MSITKQIMEERKKKGRKNGAVLGHGLKFIAFHPTTIEKQNIRSNEVSYEAIFDHVQRCMEDGLAISLKRDETRDCLSLVLRENKEFGQDAVALSFWHTDALVCFQQLVVALEDRYRGFPQTAQIALPEQDVDW